MIAAAVKEGRMPPWSGADWQRGVFKAERYLEDEERVVLISWAEGGTPEGDPADAPPLPEVVKNAQAGESGWSLGEPDLILRFDEPYGIDDDVQDIYVDLPVQITSEMLSEDRWIKSVEYRNGPAVHHIVGGVGGVWSLGQHLGCMRTAMAGSSGRGRGKSCSTCITTRSRAPERPFAVTFSRGSPSKSRER